jgi:CheY-like chemotaxis protein
METILVVDDEAQVRTLARDILLGAGYRVLEAEDGEQALRVAEDHQGAIHVLLTDIMMPGINGKELADRFMSARPDAKAIFMSGRAAEVISDAGVLIPVDAFLAALHGGAAAEQGPGARYRSPFSRRANRLASGDDPIGPLRPGSDRWPPAVPPRARRGGGGRLRSAATGWSRKWRPSVVPPSRRSRSTW